LVDTFFLQVHFKGGSSLKVFSLYATGVVDTGGEFAAGVVEIRNDPNAIIRGLGEDDSRKKLEAKNLVTL
jgi:hypothetical protein